jgi:hypothetical protein
MLRGWQEGKPISLDPIGDGHLHIKKLFEAAKPDVVFFDTLRTSHSKEENSNTEMNLIFDSLRELKLKYDFAAVLLHHMGKPGSDPTKTAPLSGRGAGVIEDRPDSLAHMTMEDQKPGVPNTVNIAFTFRNYRKIEDLRLQFDEGLGLFVPARLKTTKPPKAGAEVDVTEDLRREAVDDDDDEDAAVKSL